MAMSNVSPAPSRLQFRRARREDVPAIVALLADDAIGAAREGLGDIFPDAYWQAFASIDADPHELLTVIDDGGTILGTLQITFVRSLSRRGSERAIIEAVRVRSDRRGQGLGRQFVNWAIERARERGCKIVQLTTDKRRTDAHRFYVSLGFAATHEGMKLEL